VDGLAGDGQYRRDDPAMKAKKIEELAQDDVAKHREMAVRELIAALKMIASDHDVCPICLLFVTAEAVDQDQEASGLQHHYEEQLH